MRGAGPNKKTLTVIKNRRRLNNVALLDPLRSVQFSTCVKHHYVQSKGNQGLPSLVPLEVVEKLPAGKITSRGYSEPMNYPSHIMAQGLVNLEKCGLN